MRRAITLTVCVLSASCVGSGAPTGAHAETAIVGSPLGYSFNFGIQRYGSAGLAANTTLPESGANVSSPIAGTVVRWTVKGRYGGGPFRLRVLRPTVGGYLAVGTSSLQTPSGESAQSFATALPIHPGDLIGVENSEEHDSFGVQPVSSAAIGFWMPPPLEGSTTSMTSTNTGYELGLNATVQALPEVLLIDPSTGPTAGGTSVTIAGGGFESVVSVDFGETAASGFTVKSDRSVVATAPPSAQAGPVSVTVTTAAGTSAPVAGGRFTYTQASQPSSGKHCVVPRLRGKTLKASRKRLRRANCRLGKVTGERGAGARVRRQRPAAGKVLPAGSRVAVKLAIA